VISTSTARPMPTGVVRQSGCRSCGDCDKASGPTPPHRCPARGTGARHPGRAGARHSRPASCSTSTPGDRPSCAANAPTRTITTRPTSGRRDPGRPTWPTARCRRPRDVIPSGLDSCSCRLTAADRRWSWCPGGGLRDCRPPAIGERAGSPRQPRTSSVAGVALRWKSRTTFIARVGLRSAPMGSRGPVPDRRLQVLKGDGRNRDFPRAVVAVAAPDKPPYPEPEAERLWDAIVPELERLRLLSGWMGSRWRCCV
jgi:hypothetical protein